MSQIISAAVIIALIGVYAGILNWDAKRREARKAGA